MSACVAPKPVERAATPLVKPPATFVESEFAPYAGIGNSTVTGQAFLTIQGGEVHFGAGCEVVMVPVTSYTTEISRNLNRSNITEIFHRIARGQPPVPLDPRYSAFRRTTDADAQGNFEFRGVPAGSYYLSCLIKWTFVRGDSIPVFGGVAFAETSVAEGETAKVVVTSTYPDYLTVEERQRTAYITAHPELSERIKRAILGQYIENGMTKEQVHLAIGRAGHKNIYDSGRTEQWVYRIYGLYLYFTGDVLTSWQKFGG